MQPAITVAALVRADERLREEFPLTTRPVLIMHGTEDKATVCEGSQFHDFLSDIRQGGVMANITAWIEKRIPAAA